MSEKLNEKALLAEFKRVMKPVEFDNLDQQYWINEAKWVYGKGLGKYLSIGAHRTQSGEVEFIKLAPLFKSEEVDCYEEVVIFRNLLLELDLDDKRGDDNNSRGQAVITAKALIDHYNIKQEELYPQQCIKCYWCGGLVNIDNNSSVITDDDFVFCSEEHHQSYDTWLGQL